MNFIYIVRNFFDSLLYLFQIHIAAISAKLRKSLSKITIIQLNFGNILVVVNNLFIKLLIKKPSSFILVLSILTSLHKTLIRKASIIIFFLCRK